MKEIIDKTFGKLKMTWQLVILFAVITGIYTGAVMCVPQLKGTSFQDIGISYEWWVIFAVIIVVNCEKSWEAMLKCFVFFLISQPLVYLVEVAFGQLAMDMAIYYYKTIWFKITLLTLPGGFIAYFCKKQNALGAIILGLGNTIEFVMSIYYIMECVNKPPYHLMSALVSFASIIVMTLGIQKKNNARAIAFITPVVIAVIGVGVLHLTGRYINAIFF